MGDMEPEFSELIGQTINRIITEADKSKLTLDTDVGTYTMQHYQDCCEHVYLEDVVGDTGDLLGNPILLAEVVTQTLDDRNPPQGKTVESCTWTFYKLSTIRGSVTLRWFGESNGYYSESVSFERA